MREELYDICRETLENEEASKKFRGMQTVDDLYEYLKEKVPDLSEEEFEDFMVDAMGYYQESCENAENSTGPIGDDDLENVAGGVSLGQKIASAGLALMAFFPAAGATNFNKDAAKVGGSAGTSISQKADNQKPVASSRFQKVKNWVKNHKRLVIGTAVAAGAVIAGGVAYKVHKDNQRRAEENKKVGKNETKVITHYSSLSSAVMQGSVDGVREILKNPGKTSAAEKQEAMFEAITFGHVEVLKLLIDNGVNINGYNEHGDTALVKAVENAIYGGGTGKQIGKEMVKILLSKGADVNAKDKRGKSALEIASGHSGVYEIFLKHGYGNQKTLDKLRASDAAHQLVRGDIGKFREMLKNDTRSNKTEFLLKAAKADKPEVMKLLIEDYASNIDLNSDAGLTVLADAIYFGHAEVVDVLLKNNVKIDFNKKLTVEMGSKSKDNVDISILLSYYCKNENIRRAVLKAAVGIDGLKVKTNHGDDVPLLVWACEHENLRGDIGYLLEQGVKMDLNVKDKFGRTVLDLAAGGGDKKLVNKLLESGAEINWKNNWTLLCAAGYKGEREDVVDLLLSKHKNPLELEFTDCPGRRGDNVLVWAYDNGYNKILEKYLNADTIKNGARYLVNSLVDSVIGEKDKNMLERLMKDYSDQVFIDYFWEGALKTADPEIYRMFPQYNNQEALGEGLSAIFRDRSDVGSVNKVLTVAKDLLDKGANIDAKDRYYHEPPLTWALQSDSPELVDFLVEHGADIMVKHGNQHGVFSNKPILECEVAFNGKYLKNLVKSKTCTADVLEKMVNVCDDKIVQFAEDHNLPVNDVNAIFASLGKSRTGKHLAKKYDYLSALLRKKLNS